jgi:ATP synthase protein I
MTSQDPDRLRDLERRLEDVQQRNASRARRPAPTPLGIAGRFATELVAALVVGGGLGWGLDWLLGRIGLHTRPVFLIVFFVLGAAAGIRGVMSAAAELNARMASKDLEK